MPISYLLVPLSEHVSEHRTISVTFRASGFVDKLLSGITLENATLPIPMPNFVVIEPVISDLWPFEAAIAGN